MIRSTTLSIAAALLAASGPARSAVVYSNDFDSENGGVSAKNVDFAGLRVSYPDIDLVHTGDGSGVVCAGGAGGCVDLDGGSSGQLISDTFAFDPGSIVTLRFAISGSQRDRSPLDVTSFGFRFDQPTTGTFVFASTSGLFLADSFDATFENGFEPGTYDLLLDAGAEFDLSFNDVTFSFTPIAGGTFRFLFDDYTAFFAGDFDNDDAGRVIDNVALDISAVPEASTWAMMICGIGVAGGGLRRRSKVRTTVSFA